MAVFRAIVLSALVAGFVAGAVVTTVQLFSTVPLILKAEVYERGHQPSDAAHEHTGHEHGVAAWEPKDGLERNAYTAAANVLTAIGFALVLAGIYAIRARPVSWHEGVLWGLGGFVVFTLAPSLGLPPELPGVPSAPLEARQLWWIATAAMTALGLGLLIFRRSLWVAVLGICLLVAPHWIGSPPVPETHTDVPAALSHQFAVAVTLTSLLFWVLLGSMTSITYRRFSA
jgi:cobalt transporter subunit CbtA